MTFENVANALLKAKWIYAKTMPQYPHWYTLRRDWENKILFNEVVKYIRKHSYIDYFFGKAYQKMNLNGYQYWTMGAPISKTTLINRAKVKYDCPYDLIADKYFEIFSEQKYFEENKQLFEILDIRGKVLDIGCGDGLLLDYVDIDPQNYVGIDPSIKMLKIFQSKHPKHLVINSKFEDYYGYGFDTIVALFGVASYINPNVIHRVKSMLNSDGKIYLMFYKSNYHPIVYEKTGIEISYFDYSHIKGFEFNNYIIVTYEDLFKK